MVLRRSRGLKRACTSQPTGLEKSLARQNIVDCVYRYARGDDRIDRVIFESAIWEDGAYREHYSDQPISQIGEGLLRYLMAKSFSATHHLNGQVIVDFWDANVAYTEVYFLAFHLTRPELGEEQLRGLFGDRIR